MPEGEGTRQFVGRSVELATIGRAVDDARKGVPSVLLVGGDAGIGKSTLVGEAAARSGVRLHLGRCMHLGGDVIPLAPLVDLLRQVRRSAPEAWASVEATSLGQLTPGAPVTAATSAGGVFPPTLDLIVRLAGDDAVMVGFEDLHWADTVSWDLFEFLARNLVDEPVVLVGTYRADEISADRIQRRRLAELARLPAVHRLHLGGLGWDDVLARMTSMLGAPPDAELVDQVLTRGEGNPFFTEELVAALASGEAIPTVLSDLISADIAALDDRTRHVLGVLAAIGSDGDHELLTTVGRIEEHAVEAAIKAAIEAQLVIVDPGTDAYRFRHALIGEVVYSELLPSERRRLHRRVADALRDKTAVAGRADAAGAVAFHLDRAGDHVEAFGALLTAADAAETIAPAAALSHLLRAFELWDSVGEAAAGADRGARLWQAAEVASGTAGNDRAVDLARAAFTYGSPPLGEAWGHERLGRFLWAAGRLSESAVEYEKAAELLASESDRPEAAPAFAGLAQAELMARNYASAQRWCERVFEIVPDPSADRTAWVMARRVMGGVVDALGDPDLGVELSRQALAEAESAHIRALATVYLGSALLDAGRYDEAVTLALDGVADGRLAGLDRSFGGYLDALAVEGLTRLGRWPEAESVLSRHVGAETLPVGTIRIGRAGAMLAARRGDTERARGFLALAEAQPLDRWHQALLDWGVADVHLILGRWAEAAAAAERGWAANPPGARLWAARFAMVGTVATVEEALDARARLEPVDVEGLVARAQERIGAATWGLEHAIAMDSAAHVAHAEASLTRLTGPDPDAWSRAARRWELLSDPWAIATARMHEADAAASTGDAARASASLQEAHRFASELGAAPLVAQIAAVSRRTRVSVEAAAPKVVDAASVDRLGLTPREAEVLSLVAIGHSNRQIGEALYVSEKTASVHVSNILRKLGVTSRVDAAAVAQRLGVA